MICGVDNEIVINNIYGENDVFSGAVLDNILYYPLGGRMSIDVQTKCKVLHPPKKWNEFDYVSLHIDFFAIKEAEFRVYREQVIIDDLSIEPDGERYRLKIEENSETILNVLFAVARIQRVTPMKFNESIKGYESSLER